MLNISGLVSAAIRKKLQAKSKALAAKSTIPTKRIPTELADDPIGYAREVFGIRVWSRQREVLRAVQSRPRVSVRSGHKVSKSTTAAVLAWWWTSFPETRPEARAIATAPTGRQVKKILWREIKALHTRAARRGYILPLPPDTPGDGVQFGDGREIVGFTIDEREPESIAGFSGAWLLFILDEASGIDDRVFEALDGNAAAGARFLLISNPTRTAGAFYESQQPGSAYFAIHIDSRETPNCTGKAPPIPGLAGPEWVAEMEEKYGAESLFCTVRVHGDFPGQSDNGIIGPALLRAAVARDHEELDELLAIGLDVARFGGDETIAAPRRGRRIFPLEALPPADGPHTAVALLKLVLRLRAPHDERPKVFIDSNGIGVSVLDALLSDELVVDGETWYPTREVEAIAVNTASSASRPDIYANLRAELHFFLRDWLGDGRLPRDERLDQELRAPTYTLDRDGRILVIPKDKLRATLGRSPDRGDAAMLSILSRRAPPKVPAPPTMNASRDLSAFASR